MTVRSSMEVKLTEALAPVRLEVEDQSAQHIGHAGHRPGGETHFRIEIVSAAFAGLSRVERHRLVNALLADELAGPVHAMALSTLTPDEYEAMVG
jgi:BolA protein